MMDVWWYSVEIVVVVEELELDVEELEPDFLPCAFLPFFLLEPLAVPLEAELSGAGCSCTQNSVLVVLLRYVMQLAPISPEQILPGASTLIQ
jgi:hypothetical protein